MFERDFKAFAELLDSAVSLNPNWKPLSATGKALFFKAMEPYSLEAVSSALTGHIRDPKAGMFQPTPAHLVAQIESHAGRDGRPTADEAWAVALTSRDEAETVIWTAETAEAFAICTPVFAIGDKIGARRTFIDAYTRLVDEARRSGKPASWNASLGWDMDKREVAIQRAHVSGLLPAPTVQALLPNYAGNNVAVAQVCPEGLKKVKEEMAKLQGAWAVNAARRATEAEARRQAEAAKKAEIAQQVAEYEGKA